MGMAFAGLGGGAASAQDPVPVPDSDAGTIQGAPDGLAPPQSQVGTNGDYGYTVQSYVEFVIQDVDRKWSGWFAANGYQEPYVEYNIVMEGQLFDTDCTGGDDPVRPDTNNMYYCFLDGDGAVQAPDLPGGGQAAPTAEQLPDGEDQGGVVFPVLTMQKIWTGFVVGNQTRVAGDFGAAIVVAHEMGHHVTDEWALQWNPRQKAAGQALTAMPNGKWGELIADCFAGVLVNAVYRDGILEAGDIQEGLAAMEELGDKVAGGPMPHGTSQERTDAINAGMGHGDPTLCAQAYWKVDPAFPTRVPGA